jgi:hypothetical protein
LFHVEVAGAKGLQLTRMEYNHTDCCYYSVVGYPQRDGLRTERVKVPAPYFSSSQFVMILVPLRQPWSICST